VFPPVRGPGHFIGLQEAWGRIRARAGLSDVRLHDLRHNLASVAVGSGESLYVTGKVLGHRKARSTERHAHLADDPTRAAADTLRDPLSLRPISRASPVQPPGVTPSQEPGTSQ
jgi:integrase